VLKNIGGAKGSIVATIIASHMSRKAVAEPIQVPGRPEMAAYAKRPATGFRQT
jgi:hypothetical protein